MTLAASKANDLHAKWSDLLHNQSRTIDEVSYARILRDVDAAISSADTVGLGVLYELKAAVYNRRLNFEEALKNYRSADECHPGRPSVLNSIAACLMRLGRTDEAIKQLEALAALPTLSNLGALSIHLNLSEAYVRVQDFDNARKNALRAVIRADQNDAGHLFRLAKHHATIGCFHDAVEFLARTLAVEANRSRGDESSVELIESIAPDWRERLAHIPVIVSAVDQVIKDDATEILGPDLSTGVTVDPVATKALFDLPNPSRRSAR